MLSPRKYRDRGKEGVNEYIALKRSQDKNNSLEKKLFRQQVRTNKEILDNAFLTVMARLTRPMRDYRIPDLAIDRQWNATRRRALRTKLLKGKTNNEIAKMTRGELLSLAKTYWLETLTLSAQKVNELKEEDMK